MISDINFEFEITDETIQKFIDRGFDDEIIQRLLSEKKYLKKEGEHLTMGF